MLKKISKFLVVIGFIVASCESPDVYNSYKTVPNTWHIDSVKTFTFKAPDTTNAYNLFINLRNNNNYAFNNLFVIASLNYPNGKVLKDTLEYKMAAPNGQLLGQGFSEVKHNKLWYKGFKNKFKFTETGTYSMQLQHAMRKNGTLNGVQQLAGILEVGFSIENANTSAPNTN